MGRLVVYEGQIACFACTGFMRHGGLGQLPVRGSSLRGICSVEDS